MPVPVRVGDSCCDCAIKYAYVWAGVILCMWTVKGGWGFLWLTAALTPGCGGQSRLPRDSRHYRAAPGGLWMSNPLSDTCATSVCVSYAKHLNSYLCVFIKSENKNYKEAHSVYRLNILCGGFKSVERKVIVTIPVGCLMLCGVSLIYVRKKRIARFYYFFLWWDLKIIGLFTLGARLIPWAVLD